MNQVYVIVGMLGVAGASYVVESVMNGAGKMDESRNVNLLCKCIIGGTALTTGLVPLIKVLYSLGGK